MRGQDATLEFPEQPSSSDDDSEEGSNSASFPGYSSGQTVQFELDTKEHRLHVRIDGSLVVTVHDVDDKDVRPYLCMDYFESATLLTRNKQAPSGAALAVQDRKLAFENSAWSSEEDLALSGLSIKGVGLYFFCEKYHGRLALMCCSQVPFLKVLIRFRPFERCLMQVIQN